LRFFAAKRNLFQVFDFNLTVKIQNRTSLKVDDFLSSFSALASFEITALLLFLIILARKKLLGFVALVAFAVIHVVEIYGKTLLDHPGPAMMFYRSGTVSSIFPQWYVHPGSSYPSGHSLRIVFLGLLIAYMIIISKKLSFNTKALANLFIASIVFLTLYSRISLGEHWPSDVIGGSMLGASAALFSLIFF